jgi:hypothetical protein
LEQLAGLEGVLVVGSFIEPARGADQVTGAHQLAELGVDAFDDVAGQAGVQRLVDGPEVPLGHGVGQHLGGAGVALESEQRIVAAGARAPEPETVTAHQRGHGGGVEQAGIGGRVLQVPVHVLAQAGDAVDADVGQGLVPADLLVDLGPQTQRAGHGRGGG